MSKAFEDMKRGLKEVEAFLAGESVGSNVTLPAEADVKSVRRELTTSQAHDQDASGCSLTESTQSPTLRIMNVEFTIDQKAFARQAVENGRLDREEDAVLEALELWEERERSRAQILAAVDRAELSLTRGEGRVITAESMGELGAEVKLRGRARLAALQAASR